MNLVLFVFLCFSSVSWAIETDTRGRFEDQQSYFDKVGSVETEAILYELVELYKSEQFVEFQNKVEWLGLYLAGQPDKAQVYIDRIEQFIGLGLNDYVTILPVVVGLTQPLADQMTPFWDMHFRLQLQKLEYLNFVGDQNQAVVKALDASVMVSSLSRYKEPIEDLAFLVQSLLQSEACQTQRACIRAIYSAYRPVDLADYQEFDNQVAVNQVIQKHQGKDKGK